MSTPLTGVKGITMKVTLTLVAFLLLCSSAGAATTVNGNMAAAIRALHYPKAGALKLGCKASGDHFNCKAIYRHHRVRRFQAEWSATPAAGLICAGKRISACGLLAHGFVPADQVGTTQSGTAGQVALGYMHVVKDVHDVYVGSGCPQSSQPSTWTFCYAWTDSSNIGVTVNLRHVKTGYVTTTTSAIY